MTGRPAIPTGARERGERAVLAMLRRRFPDVVFEIRDASVRPDDPHVLDEVTGRPAGDDDPMMHGLAVVYIAAHEFSSAEEIS